MESRIEINSRIKKYYVTFIRNVKNLRDLVGDLDDFYIVDNKVWNYYSNRFISDIRTNSRTYFITSNERNKSLKNVFKLYDFFLEQNIKRNSRVLSIGGGIVQDLSGFASSTIFRGVNWIYFPTTLLSQADSCIGGKTSINYQNYKNPIGTFYPPDQIFIVPEFLLSLKRTDFFSGLGEIIKIHIIGGENTTKNLLLMLPGIKQKDLDQISNCIYNSLLIKKLFVDEDEFDRGRRAILNYGHTFGHAIETATHFKIPHGQGVIFGILAANIIAYNRKILSKSLFDYLTSKLLLPNFVIKLSKLTIQPELIFEAMKKDKKRVSNKYVIISLNDNFQLTKLDDVTIEEINEALITSVSILSGY